MDVRLVPEAAPSRRRSLTFNEGYLRFPSGQSALRHHWAAERLLDGAEQVILVLRGDIEPVVLLGEALGVEDALVARPREPFHPQANDMDGPAASSMEPLANVAR